MVNFLIRFIFGRCFGKFLGFVFVGLMFTCLVDFWYLFYFLGVYIVFFRF